MKVLVAEDDQFTRQGLIEVLQDEGFAVIAAADGDQAVAQFRAEQPDFICLDVMMPGQSGYQACRAIREASPNIPIIFISAKSEEMDRLVGFDAGADDFITKPFSVLEVVARVRAVARRCHSLNTETPDEFRFGDLMVIPAELRAKRNQHTIDLSLRDIEIMKLLMENAGKALDRNTILNRVWGESYLPNSRTLDQHISQLRKRIEIDARVPRLIHTVHGVGYRYEVQKKTGSE